MALQLKRHGITRVHPLEGGLARGEVKRRHVLSSWTAVLDYCRTAQGFADREQFRVLFLDKRNALIADEVQQTGTVDHTPVYPREVVKRALEMARPLGIAVHDHLIVGKDGHASLKALKLI